MKLSNPSKSGFEMEVENVEEAKAYAARNWFDCSASEIVEVNSPDGSAVYLYETQEAADSDADGAYSVKVTF